MSETLHIVTYNIHKGLSHFNRRLVLHELRDLLRQVHADVVFLQEVMGAHRLFAERHDNWPAQTQYEFLADAIWGEYAYGKNAVYPAGHHGNALLSKLPINSWHNEDVSAHRLDNRGLLHCELHIPGWSQPLHCVCVHLGLVSRWRKKQLLALRHRIEQWVPPQAPLIVAGDFNDWRFEAGREFARALHLKEAFEQIHGAPARSFPAKLPMLCLDRIYVRGLEIESATVHSGRPWSKLSDHAALSAVLRFNGQSK